MAGRFVFGGSSAPRRLPGAAAAVAGNDPRPPAATRIAGEPAAAARLGCADGDIDRNGAATADAAGDLAAPGGRNPRAGHGEGNAVARTAIAPLGGEQNVPDPVIGSHPGIGGAVSVNISVGASKAS